jgi:mono/diheme cytochrome c family protein
MNQTSSLKSRLRAGFGLLAIIAALYTMSLAFVTAQDTKPAEPKPTDTNAPPATTVKKAEKKSLTGAELYAINCNRCHSERYATEFTSAQWKTIMIHMRVRANLPAAQAREILKYLQEDSGN